MNTVSTPDLTRSEAFVEDLGPLFADRTEREHPSVLRWARLVPLGVALLGLAFAVLPPL
jgi:hypothetical protein